MEIVSPVTQMREPQVTAESLARFLDGFSANSARIWGYAVSHCYLQIRVSASESDYIMISMLGCSFLSGPTGWKNPDLKFSVTQADDSGSHHWRLWDDGSGFSANANCLYWGRLPETSPYAGWFSLERPRFNAQANHSPVNPDGG